MNKRFDHRAFTLARDEACSTPSRETLMSVASFTQDATLAELLGEELEAHSIALSHHMTRDRILPQMAAASVDVAIVDDHDGWSRTLSLIQSLRAATPVGIIFLSERTARDDRLLALSLGADHVLAKPLDMAELLAILRNMSRFAAAGRHSPRVDEENDSWTLDHVHWRLIAPSDEGINLSTSEFAVLSRLMHNPGIEQPREQLAQHLHARRSAGNMRALDVLISKLRAKVERETGRSLPLRSARGIGYVFVGAVTASRAAQLQAPADKTANGYVLRTDDR